MKAKVIFTTLAGILLCYSGIYAQISVSGSANQDQATRKILTIPQLQPPKEVIESGLGGNVRVKVMVDSDGNVTSVEDVVGPGAVCRQVTRTDVIAMRSSAKEAAMTAKFEPAKQPTDASGIWLNFNFPGSEEETDFDDNSVERVTEGAKYTIKSDQNFQVEGPPPSGYKASANTSSTTTAPATLPKKIPGGVLNGKAIELPKPAYPPAARAVRATGAVSIRVLIDEKGEVFLAKAVEGHPLLRAASVVAACGSRFPPTQLSGQPVKVSGIITYNFVP